MFGECLFYIIDVVFFFWFNNDYYHYYCSEFWLAEIEYFVHPKRSDHIRFNEIASCPVRLFPIDSQLGSRVVLVRGNFCLKKNQNC